MGHFRWTSSRHRLPAAVTGIASALLALLLIVLVHGAPATMASDTATWQARLARDAERVVDAQQGLAAARSELVDVQLEHGRVREQLEARLVAIYKAGGGPVPIAHAAAAGSVRDVDGTIEVLRTVARYDEREVRRWNQLARRIESLQTGIERLERELADARADVRRDRRELKRARAAAEAARRRAAELARAAAPVLGVSAIDPETVQLKLAEQEHATAGSIATSSDAAAGDDAAEATAAEPSPVGYVQTGEASMYADHFAGESTANGEAYDPAAFTAAHPSLPFGTWVTVTGPGGTVSVRINDRGPFVGGRIIDLSRAAAQAVGLPGVGQVRIAVQG